MRSRAAAFVLVASVWTAAVCAAPPDPISGVVRDDRGPTPDATVRIQTTSRATRTDAQGRFELGVEGKSLRVPRRAVVREFELDYVYELEAAAADGRIATARRRRVQTRPVAFRPDLVELTSGLEPGRSIATTGVRDLRDGLRVRVRTTEGLSGSAP